jgi:hypothetical protein
MSLAEMAPNTSIPKIIPMLDPTSAGTSSTTCLASTRLAPYEMDAPVARR